MHLIIIRNYFGNTTEELHLSTEHTNISVPETCFVVKDIIVSEPQFLQIDSRINGYLTLLKIRMAKRVKFLSF